ncbi:MAG: hypothetical protein AB7F67_18290 [Rhodospirillaceae bacterium]
MRAIAALLCLLGLASAAAAQEIAVEASNRSVPTLCAEEDNVHISLAAPAIRRFRIEARHPAYIGTLNVDRWAPDFSHCTAMATGPEYDFAPRRVTLFETVEWQLIGYTFAKFWRRSAATVRVGERVERDLHLVQLWTRFQERAEEVLVLYPGDGYWRARPLPPAHLRWSAYGSSFLVGPVEEAGRPIVDLRAVAFDPATRTFTLDFARGGGATLRVDALDQDRIALDVAFDAPPQGLPFAALRSMFVTEVNADVAHVNWREKDSKAWRTAPVLSFTAAQAVELWAGRLVPSRHNTSAPDMTFGGFESR